MFERWKQSAGSPLIARVIYTIPLWCLTGPAALLNWLAGHATRLDAFCRRCRWRRLQYGLWGFLNRTYHEDL